jgi:colicin import membrane protein
MNERYTRSVIWSALIHGAVFALVFLVGLIAQRFIDPPPVPFELVAGEGDNFQATEAPAAAPAVLTTPQPRPQPQVTPPPPQPAPQPAPQPVRQTTPPPKAAPTPEPIPTPPQKQATQPMTKEEFDRQNPRTQQKAPAPAPPRPVQKIDVDAISRGVQRGTAPPTAQGAGGTALTRQQQDALTEWFALLTQRLRQNFTKPTGVSDALVARARIDITATGGISGQVATSSGNAAFDAAVNEAIRRTAQVGMPPKPDRRAETVEVPFRMVDLPGQ